MVKLHCIFSVLLWDHCCWGSLFTYFGKEHCVGVKMTPTTLMHLIKYIGLSKHSVSLYKIKILWRSKFTWTKFFPHQIRSIWNPPLPPGMMTPRAFMRVRSVNITTMPGRVAGSKQWMYIKWLKNNGVCRDYDLVRDSHTFWRRDTNL